VQKGEHAVKGETKKSKANERGGRCAAGHKNCVDVVLVIRDWVVAVEVHGASHRSRPSSQGKDKVKGEAVRDSLGVMMLSTLAWKVKSEQGWFDVRRALGAMK
jgi:hypothetical protein